MSKTVGDLKTLKLSYIKLEQVPRDSGVSFEHKDTDYSCS